MCDVLAFTTRNLARLVVEWQFDNLSRLHGTVTATDHDFGPWAVRICVKQTDAYAVSQVGRSCSCCYFANGSTFDGRCHINMYRSQKIYDYPISSRSSHGIPPVHSCRSELAQCSARDQMSLDVECVVDSGVG